MTYRERKAAKAARLREWAEAREAKQSSLDGAARMDEETTGIPFGQPILVGHSSEGRHRRAIARGESAMRAAVENADKAASMASRADSIEAANDRAIYDDDPDAVERLTAKLARLEQQREGMKARNAEYRKAHREQLKGMSAYERGQAVPFPAYAISNLGGVITNTRQRITRLSRPESGRPMLARRAGDCRKCEHGIEAGQSILWFRRAGEAEHKECPSC